MKISILKNNRKILVGAVILFVISLSVFYCWRHRTPTHYDEVYRSTPNIGEGVNTVEGVVLHHTATNNIKAALHTFRTAENQVSCHVLIVKDGKRYVFARPEQIAWHAGRSSLHGKIGCNDFTIGIEFLGNTLEQPLTKRQIASAIEYLCPIIEKYHIPMENIVTHEMIRDEWIKSQNDTLCPTKQDIVQSEYLRFMKKLKKRLESERR